MPGCGREASLSELPAPRKSPFCDPHGVLVLVLALVLCLKNPLRILAGTARCDPDVIIQSPGSGAARIWGHPVFPHRMHPVTDCGDPVPPVP